MLCVPTAPSLTALREFLIESGYTSTRLSKELGLKRGLQTNLGNLEPLLERTSGDSTLPLLARLFFIGWPVAIASCAKHIPANVLQLCLESGLLAVDGENYAPEFVIVPFEDTLFFSVDAGRLRGTREDIVIGPSGTTNIIAKSLLRTPTKSVLDIGTGSGVLAVVASRFSEHVIGVDINERAVECARFNAALNGVANVEFVAGDAFAPAQGRRFSRIIANPPFFLAPRKRFTYSDSPLVLDGFTRKLAMEAPQYLEENGIFQMICEWVEVEGESADDRLRSWTQDSDCDVFVFFGPVATPIEYAENRFAEAGSLHTGENSMAERMNYFREHKVKRILSGVINMRRRQGKNWFAVVPGSLSDQAANATAARLYSLTLLSEYSDARWLETKLRLTPDTVITQTQSLKEHGWALTGATVSKPDGVNDPVQIDGPVLKAVELFDGTNTLTEIIHIVARLLGIPPQEAAERCLALAKRLVQSSFILPLEISPQQTEQVV